MPSVGMVGKNGHEMARAFLHLCRGAANCYNITERQQYGPKLNILVADASVPVLSAILPRLSADDYLIVNADDADIFPLLGKTRAKVITYGFNPRACITASSVTEDGLQVCIQRAFVDLEGITRTPQEFSAPVTERFRGETPAGTLLGAAAAWAVLGNTEGSKPLSA